MEPIALRPAAECTACGACYVGCPVQAISMEEDSLGCKYPVIDHTSCIGCGTCVKKCQALDTLARFRPIEAYAAFGREEALVQNSASGGMFASLAKACMERGGMAAGAVMEKENGAFQISHILSGWAKDIPRMQGSKYAQSDAWNSYGAVIQALQLGKTVLFSGTPCQVAAVKSLTGDPDNLVTMDLVCHGVPPVKMLNEFLHILQKRLGGCVEQFVFRDKSCGKDFYARVDVKKHGRANRCFLSAGVLSYYKYFLEGAIYRENCYTCPYAGLERVSDLTIGDYWGVKEVHRDSFSSGQMPQGKTWSCLLVNTEKGQRFVTAHEDALQLFRSEAVLAAKNNGQLREPSKKPRRFYPIVFLCS